MRPEPKSVRDVMLGVEDVPTVREGATLADAARTLEASQRDRPDGRLPFRALLILNDRGQVVGKLGHLGFLKAVEPGFEGQQDLQALDRAHADPEIAAALAGHMRFLGQGLGSSCHRAAGRRVEDVMRPVDEFLDEGDSLVEAAAALVRLQTLSLPVRRGKEVVGLLRLADLYEVVAGLMIAGSERSDDPREE